MLSHDELLRVGWMDVSQHTTLPPPRPTQTALSLAEHTTPCPAESIAAPPDSNDLERERDLVQAMKAGERAAFQELYQLHAPRLFRRLLRLTGAVDQAEDCLQQGFVNAIENIQHYRGEGSFYGWLSTITTNLVLELFRRHGRERTLLADFSIFFHRSRQHQKEPIPEELFLLEERKDIVQKALQRLDPRKRIVVLLCDLEGEKLEDVATQLNIPKGTIGSRLHHARRELREYISFELKQSGISAEEWFHA